MISAAQLTWSNDSDSDGGENAHDLGVEVMRRALARDWRQLFPLRRDQGRRIQALLRGTVRGHVDARVAFGMLGAEHASDWLYRDFYIEAAPRTLSVDRAFGTLRRGNPQELMALLGSSGQPEQAFRRMWYEVSTLVGRVVGSVVMERDGEHEPAPFETTSVAAARPREPPGRVAQQAKVAAALCAALDAPLGIELHRQNLVRSLDQLLAGELGGAYAGSTFALLVHHMDVAPRGHLAWAELPPQQAAAMRHAMHTLRGKITTRPRFFQLLCDGLCSPSRQRRFLSYRLLRLDGLRGPAAHPDDLMPLPAWPRTAERMALA